jgi:choline-sulfatase
MSAHSADRQFDHVVLISLDTLRSDGIAANERKLWPEAHPAVSPRRSDVLDALVGEGIFFTNCVASAPYTSASHASFLTGRWPRHHGVFELFNRKLRKPTLFKECRRLGYRTVMKVDFPLMLGHHLGFTSDVDEYLVEDDEGSIEAIGSSPASVSLVHFGGIHAPYGFHNVVFGGDDYRAKVQELEALVGVAPRSDDDHLDGRYTAALQTLHQQGAHDLLFSLYLEGIEYFLEHRFGPYLDRLRSRLAGTRHLIVLFGDHGEEFDDDNFGHQTSVAEGVLRVPLVFVGEGIEPGRQRHERVRAVDLVPTVLDAIGGRAPRALAGRSLAPAVWDDAPTELLPSYAQSWVPRTEEYIAFVSRAMKRGRNVGSLEHVCYREAIYDETEKVTRENYALVSDGGRWSFEPIAAVVRLERIVSGGSPRTIEDEARAAALVSALDAYGSDAPVAASSAPVDIEPVVRARLRSLGYRV